MSRPDYSLLLADRALADLGESAVGENADPLLRSIAIDRAALAIAPIVLGLTEAGKAALAGEGSMYLTDAELEKLYSIVHIVRRELSKPV